MKHKFTLLELLIVVAIIGILISLLLPSLSKAREAAKTAVCLSNQKQVSIAIISYQEEGLGFLPQVDKIDRFLLSRDEGTGDVSAWTCPSRNRSLEYVTEQRPVSYSFSLNGLKWVEKKHLAKIYEPATSLIYGDGRENFSWGSWIFIDATADLGGYTNWTNEDNFFGGGHQMEDKVYIPESDIDAEGGPSGLRYRHLQNQSLNAAYFDGHATPQRKYSLTKRNFVTAF
ncbi:MAG: prepilin-type N-terminal cleavage/methylation domain-containing protein [Lentisphaeraceae bacterium]|nr:prepilin-type N-terminal cleavage/methylation domain-containing protein [Lentisphaeraceae bacterium]